MKSLLVFISLILFTFSSFGQIHGSYSIEKSLIGKPAPVSAEIHLNKDGSGYYSYLDAPLAKSRVEIKLQWEEKDSIIHIRISKYQNVIHRFKKSGVNLEAVNSTLGVLRKFTDFTLDGSRQYYDER